MYQFIKFSSMQLTQPGNQVTQCEEDANIVIVKQALEIAATVTVPCNYVSRWRRRFCNTDTSFRK